MDWGLVLASQGIMATIDDGATGEGWGLVVSAEDYPAAIEAIRLHRQENRHWRWRQPISWRGLLFDWRVLFWAALTVAIYYFSQTTRPDLRFVGRMDNAAVQAGEWWRLFTAIFLHADIAHLIANVSFGLILLGLVMGRFGGGLGLLAAYFAGLMGNVAGLILYSQTHLGVGASGMVMGGLGLLAAQSLAFARNHPVQQKHVFRGILSGVMLFVLFGLSPGTDVIAHFSGFVAGLIFGGLLLLVPTRWQTSTPLQFCAGLVLVASIIAPWWAALR